MRTVGTMIVKEKFFPKQYKLIYLGIGKFSHSVYEICLNIVLCCIVIMFRLQQQHEKKYFLHMNINMYLKYHVSLHFPMDCCFNLQTVANTTYILITEIGYMLPLLITLILVFSFRV